MHEHRVFCTSELLTALGQADCVPLSIHAFDTIHSYISDRGSKSRSYRPSPSFPKPSGRPWTALPDALAHLDALPCWIRLLCRMPLPRRFFAVRCPKTVQMPMTWQVSLPCRTLWLFRMPCSCRFGCPAGSLCLHDCHCSAQCPGPTGRLKTMQMSLTCYAPLTCQKTRWWKTHKR